MQDTVLERRQRRGRADMRASTAASEQMFLGPQRQAEQKRAGLELFWAAGRPRCWTRRDKTADGSTPEQELQDGAAEGGGQGGADAGGGAARRRSGALAGAVRFAKPPMPGQAPSPGRGDDRLWTSSPMRRISVDWRTLSQVAAAQPRM